MDGALFAEGAEVEVGADGAFVADSFDGFNEAELALDFVDLVALLDLLLGEELFDFEDDGGQVLLEFVEEELVEVDGGRRWRVGGKRSRRFREGLLFLRGNWIGFINSNNSFNLLTFLFFLLLLLLILIILPLLRSKPLLQILKSLRENVILINIPTIVQQSNRRRRGEIIRDTDHLFDHLGRVLQLLRVNVVKNRKIEVILVLFRDTMLITIS